MIGERIKRARMAAGLSQREVAAQAKLSAMAISKFERNETTPASDTLIRIARALNTRLEFFFRPDTVTLGKPEYRKRSNLRKKQLNRIEERLLNQVERLFEIESVYPTSPVPDFTIPDSIPDHIFDLGEIEDIAIKMREAWFLGFNAIQSLTATFEEHGLLVLVATDESGKFDGLAATVAGRPLVVIGEIWPGDRQRFTMAHELGHLVMAGRLSESIDTEKACNRFAGAFLVPSGAVVSELGQHRNCIEHRELYALKHKYGLSMMAWIFRAHDTGVIDRRTRDGLFRSFSTRGWRKQEPGKQLPSESPPQLFERLVLRALAENMISMSKAAELMGLSLYAFQKQLSFERLD